MPITSGVTNTFKTQLLKGGLGDLDYHGSSATPLLRFALIKKDPVGFINPTSIGLYSDLGTDELPTSSASGYTRDHSDNNLPGGKVTLDQNVAVFSLGFNTAGDSQTHVQLANTTLAAGGMIIYKIASSSLEQYVLAVISFGTNGLTTSNESIIFSFPDLTSTTGLIRLH